MHFFPLGVFRTVTNDSWMCCLKFITSQTMESDFCTLNICTELHQTKLYLWKCYTRNEDKIRHFCIGNKMIYFDCSLYNIILFQKKKSRGKFEAHITRRGKSGGPKDPNKIKVRSLPVTKETEKKSPSNSKKHCGQDWYK